jgi:hypothetical protein
VDSPAARAANTRRCPSRTVTVVASAQRTPKSGTSTPNSRTLANRSV